MDYTELGRTGLNVSVAGLGCGGNSRLGQGQGKSEQQSVSLVRRAIDLGVNFFDTAEAYGTEAIVGKAIAGGSRDKVVISTKARIVRDEALLSPSAVIESLEASLKRLNTDYVDVFHLHGIVPQRYEYAVNELLPALEAEKAKGKIRHIGITEAAARDANHEMLHRAINDARWEVVMLAYHMMSQNAWPTLFPSALRNGVGTLLMFVVRNIFSQPDYLQRVVRELVQDGSLNPDDVNEKDPLSFLVHEGGALSVVDAAYRFARYEPGANVVLFGTGSEAHLESNIASILRPPLPSEDVERLYALFGELTGIGLDAPHRKPPPVAS
ncbi:MAG: aldo/keto reductase [Gammaproteobacteria bacterium]|nr:aldo/keto reductase [Gammaproteobacteria bacterium]